MCSSMPNALPREEFLIVLEYLLKFTNDEKTASTQAKIIEYAKKEYNSDIRRERIGQILDHLYELTSKYSNKFPFKLEVKKLNQTCKYYITRRSFDDVTIERIVQAIRDNKCFSVELTDKLVEEFLNAETNELKRKQIQKKLTVTNNIDKMSETNSALYCKLSDAQSDNKMISFKFKMMNKVTKLDEDIFKTIPRDLYTGFVYDVKDYGGIIKAVIYLHTYKTAIITRIDNIVLKNVVNLGNNTPNYKLNNDKYKSIGDWVKAHYSGKDGEVKTITFQFETGTSDNYLKEVAKRFNEHFKERLNYEEVGNGKTDDSKLVQATIVCNEESFKKWYLNYDILRGVTIVSPSDVVDNIVGPMVKALNGRLVKYGSLQNQENS